MSHRPNIPSLCFHSNTQIQKPTRIGGKQIKKAYNTPWYSLHITKLCATLKANKLPILHGCPGLKSQHLRGRASKASLGHSLRATLPQTAKQVHMRPILGIRRQKDSYKFSGSQGHIVKPVLKQRQRKTTGQER